LSVVKHCLHWKTWTYLCVLPSCVFKLWFFQQNM